MFDGDQILPMENLMGLWMIENKYNVNFVMLSNITVYIKGKKYVTFLFDFIRNNSLCLKEKSCWEGIKKPRLNILRFNKSSLNNIITK